MDQAEGDLKQIQAALNTIMAQFVASRNEEGSVLTTCADDDKAFWRELRKELERDGFRGSVIRKHKDTIKAYVKELGSRGLLDDEASSSPQRDPENTGETFAANNPRADSVSTAKVSASTTDLGFHSINQIPASASPDLGQGGYKAEDRSSSCLEEIVESTSRLLVKATSKTSGNLALQDSPATSIISDWQFLYEHAVKMSKTIDHFFGGPGTSLDFIAFNIKFTRLSGAMYRTLYCLLWKDLSMRPKQFHHAIR